MRSFPPSIETMLASGLHTLVGNWHITRRDGEVLRSTEFDRDIVIASGDLAGTYTSNTSISGGNITSNADLAADNLQAEGTLLKAGEFAINGVSPQDLEAGLLDLAEAQWFLVNWQDPDAWQGVLRYGTLGNIKRDDSGRWTCELLGLSHRYGQPVGRSYSKACNVVKFGDPRCGVNRDSYRIDATVDNATGTRVLELTADLGSPPFPVQRFANGEIRVLTGLNAGYSKEIKVFDGSTLECWEAFPFAFAPGDTAHLWPDCFRDLASCQFYGNLARHRGFPNLPGPDELIKLRSGPARKKGGGGGK